MSDKKPFARVVEHNATQGVLYPGADYEVTGWQIAGETSLEGVFFFDKENAQAKADAINAAVAQREREAVVEELRDLARVLFPDEGDRRGIYWAILSRADAIEKGGAS